jgi:hypothetical protein
VHESYHKIDRVAILVAIEVDFRVKRYKDQLIRTLSLCVCTCNRTSKYKKQ